MIKKLVFLWDSTVKPWSTDVPRILDCLTRVERKGVACERLDANDMPEEELERWRKEALTTSIWRHQQIRQHFGASQLDLGRRAPALFVCRAGERVPAAVYPHTKKRGGQEKTDYSIESYLGELVDSLGG